MASLYRYYEYIFSRSIFLLKSGSGCSSHSNQHQHLFYKCLQRIFFQNYSKITHQHFSPNGLNKITQKVISFCKILTGKVRFYSLAVKLKSCKKAHSEARLETCIHPAVQLDPSFANYRFSRYLHNNNLLQKCLKMQTGKLEHFFQNICLGKGYFLNYQ